MLIHATEGEREASSRDEELRPGKVLPMLIEMHAHTSGHSPCSHIDAVTLVRRVQKKGLQGLVITEHEYLWEASEIEKLKDEAPVEEPFVLLAAQEVDTDMGHVLVYGADRSITGKVRVAELRKLYPNAAFVWAHPLRSGKMPEAADLLSPDLDGIEIFNNNHSAKENYLGLQLWHRHKFTAIGGSDTHAAETAGTLPTLFDHPVPTMEELVAELKNGRCRPMYKEIPRTGSNIVIDELTLGTKGEDESRQRIIAKKPKTPERWDGLRQSSETLREVQVHGFSSGTFRVPTIVEIDLDRRFVIEEGQRGRNLFSLLVHIGRHTGRKYFRSAAHWLARLHTAGIASGALEETDRREHQRFEAYLRAFSKTKSPYLHIVGELVEKVRLFEEDLLLNRENEFVLIHGDYHPKNIIIGQDLMQDIGTIYISVVDFGSSLLFHPVFDVGCFISQFRNQFRQYPEVIRGYEDEEFVEAYLSAVQKPYSDRFRRELKLFRVRANLSIASFLVHVGKGTSEDMRKLVEESCGLID